LAAAGKRPKVIVAAVARKLLELAAEFEEQAKAEQSRASCR